MQSQPLRIGLGAAVLAAFLSWFLLRPETSTIATSRSDADRAASPDASHFESYGDREIDNHGPRPIARSGSRHEGSATAETRTDVLARRIEKSIDAMDLAEIQRELGVLAGIDEEWLKRDDIDPRAFAKRLAAIAGRGFSFDPLSSGARFERVDDVDDGRDLAPLAFSSSYDEVHGALASSARFASTDVTILAHLRSDALDAAHDPVLVRWIDAAGARIEMMQAVRLTPDAGSGTRSFAMRRAEGWTIGRRDVEVYAIEDGLPRIAAGSFEVVAGNDLPWLDATSSIEIRSITGTETDEFLDAIRPVTGSVRIGVRSVADLTGAVLRLARGHETGASIELALRPDADGTAWWSAELDEELDPGIWEARIERFGSLLERKSFRSLTR